MLHWNVKKLESTRKQTYAQLFIKDICANSEKFEILCISNYIEFERTQFSIVVNLGY